jgi:hypothetical protein
VALPAVGNSIPDAFNFNMTENQAHAADLLAT